MAPRVDCRLPVTRVMVALAIVAIPLPALGAAPETTPGPAVQGSEGDRVAAPSESPPPVQRPAEVVPPPTDATTPAEPAPTTPIEAAPTDAASTDAVPADALEAQPAAPTTPAPAVATRRAAVEEEMSPSEAITAEYGPRYRPADNPGRLNIAVRGLFVNAGGSKIVGGRLGGVAADVGQSWNHFGYAVTGTVYGGRLVLEDATDAEVNALIGVGPTVGLGRLALLGRGYLDVRLGYDFFYGVVNQNTDQTIVQGMDPGDVTVTKAKNLIPHGPRVRLDLGLLSLDTRRRYFHGFGVSMGYQALVGSMNGGLPPVHMLTLGLSYWMG
jgi:hypothetical protein